MAKASTTAKTSIIGPCAMSSEIPDSGKVTKNTAKGELLSASERHKKNKKALDLTGGGNSYHIARGPIIEILLCSAPNSRAPDIAPNTTPSSRWLLFAS